jgi:hypothetical protein
MLLNSSSMKQSPRRKTSNPNTEILNAAAIAKKWNHSTGIEISRSSEIPFATRALQGWRQEKKVHSWIENQNLHLQLLRVLTIVHFSTTSTERHQNFTSQRPYSSPPIFTENTRFLSKPSWHPKAFFSKFHPRISSFAETKSHTKKPESERKSSSRQRFEINTMY